MKRVLDSVVVGAGPAGLAASAALTDRGIEHEVLERGRVGESWRTQRWDSFRLNTPGWMNQMLGGQARSAYAPAGEVVQRLERLAADCPIQAGVGVTRLAPAGDGYALRTANGELRARTVVVATGAENVPRIPALARAFPDRVGQHHAADYRRPGFLPNGAVLVVGSGQSGCQIAEDLRAEGRHVVLATSPVGRAPTPYRGRDTVDWLVEAGFFYQRPQDLPDPSMMRAPNPLLAPGGRSLSLQALARAGITLVGRPVAVNGERISLDASVAANVAAGDIFAARARAMVDDIIRRRGLDAPPPESDDTGAPFELNPPMTLDLRAHEIASVVWCTGFTGDFSWLDPALLDTDGQPRHEDAAASVPGVWYLGLRWLIRRGSSLLYGLPGDAVPVARAVEAHLGNRAVRRATSSVMSSKRATTEHARHGCCWSALAQPARRDED
jgi:putative flavoprotein involved in K+ transport